MNMKRIERKGRIFQTVIAICVVFSIMLATSSVSYAATPTLDSEFATLVVGTNDLKVENYDGSQTMAGCFTAPEKGNYKFYAVNIGELRSGYTLLNNNFSKEENKRFYETGSQCDFKTYLLEQGQKMYFYTLAYGLADGKTGTLATRFVIEKEEQKLDMQVNNIPVNTTPANTTPKKTTVSKSNVTISRKSCSLKKGKKIKLKLKKLECKPTFPFCKRLSHFESDLPIL